MGIPPGPAYLGQIIPSFVVPPIVVYGTLRLLQQQTPLSLPNWAIISLLVASNPLRYVFGIYYRRIRNYLAAKELGARLVPHVEEKWPYFGGMSIIPMMVKMFNNGYIADVVPEWNKTYGPVFELRLASENQIWTVEPDHVKAVLATQFDNFEKGPKFIPRMHTFLGTGVFNSDGEMWKFHRAMTRPYFTRERISDFDIFDEHAEATLSIAKARLAEGYAIDFQDLVARFTLDSASAFLLGEDVRSLSAGIAYPPNSGRENPPNYTTHPSNIFVNAFFTGLNEVALRLTVGDQWALREFWSDKVKPQRVVVDQYIEPMITKMLQDRVAEKAGSKDLESIEKQEGQTLLQHLVEQTQDTTILKDELLNLLVAGRDTTASTLTFSFYKLAEHPKVARRLREEILSRVGDSRRPTYEDIREMKYLRAFINEVLRLYPPVPFDARTSKNATTLPSKDGSKPIYIPASTQVTYSVFIMHRRKDLWGPDADEFDPDRFLDHRLHKYLTPNPFIFCPFNAGPRICLGQQFAYHETSFFLIRLLQQFSQFSLALDAQPPETIAPASWAQSEGTKATEKIMPASNLTMYVRGGLWVRMA